MEDKILEILLEMQKDMNGIKGEMNGIKGDIKGIKGEINGIKDEMNEMKDDINTKLDRLEFKMNDGFETLELLSKNNTNELNKVKIKVSELEKRMNERDIVN